ncbi:MAG: hypothetical protein HOF01_02180 [Chloroflexi bacterium]|nr:hypothetical protein [Chloroflexota bacterium]
MPRRLAPHNDKYPTGYSAGLIAGCLPVILRVPQGHILGSWFQMGVTYELSDDLVTSPKA